MNSIEKRTLIHWLMAGAALYISDMCGNLASTCNWAELAVLVDPKWPPGSFCLFYGLIFIYFFRYESSNLMFQSFYINSMKKGSKVPLSDNLSQVVIKQPVNLLYTMWHMV